MKGYLSYSTSNEIRYMSSSGGFCKELLRYLIEAKIYDKAILTELGDGETALIPQTVITDDMEKILSTKSNSIYANTQPLSVLPELKQDESYVFVGLPCHVKTVREYSRKHGIDILVVCLFCNHTPDFGYTKYILDKHGIDERDVTHFEYRGTGWAGKTKIKTRDNEILIDFPSLWSSYNNNTPTPLKKCRCCAEFISDQADICVGDAWIERITKKDDLGTNIVIGMNEIGNDLIKKCGESGCIVVENLDDEEFQNYMDTQIRKKNKRKRKWCK